jgi:hypothetical protein
MTPLSPYQLIYDLLVDHLQDMNHQGRIAWLEQGDLRYLVAYLAPDQPTTVFVPDLLVAAYHHGGEGDASLRHLLVYLRAAYGGTQPWLTWCCVGHEMEEVVLAGLGEYLHILHSNDDAVLTKHPTAINLAPYPSKFPCIHRPLYVQG